MTRLEILTIACLTCTGGAPLALGAEQGPQQGQQKTLTDSYGDPLPPQALARLGTVRFRHGHFITSIAFAPDGKTLASKDSDGRVSLWDLATGKRIREFAGQSGPYAGAPVVFSPDGQVLAFGDGSKALLMWEAATGKLLRKFPGKGTLTSLAFSPDGKTLALGGDGKPRAQGDFGMETVLLNAVSGEELRRFVGHQARVAAIAFAPDGRTLASGSHDNTIRLWDVATGKETQQFLGHKHYIQALAFSADGKFVASGDWKGSIFLWEPATGKEGRLLSSGSGEVYSIAFSPDGKHLAVGGWRSHLIGLWEVASGNLVRQFGQAPNEKRSSSICSCVAFSPDGKTLAGRGHHHCVLSLWDVATGKELHAFDAHGSAVQALAASGSGEWLASGSRDEAVCLWQSGTGKLVAQLSKSGPPVKALAFAANSLAALVEGGSIRVWTLTTRTELPALRCAAQEAFTSLAFTCDNDVLAAGHANGTVSFWNTETGKKLRHFQAHPIRTDPDGDQYTAAVSTLVFSPDGKTLATSLDAEGEGYLFDAATGKQLRRFQAASSKNSSQKQVSLAFSADGKTLVVGAGGKMVSFCEVATGKERHQITGQNVAGPGRSHSYYAARVNWSYALAFSPDGRTMASWGNDLVRLWDLASGQELAKCYGHDGYVHAAVFSPDGRSLVTAGEDTTILIWNADVASKESPPTPVPTAQELAALWNDLAGNDSPRAFQAINKLAAAPEQALALCRTHLRPMPVRDARPINQLIADLDDAQFELRQKATDELEKLDVLAAPALQKALADKPALEVRQRLERLLARLEERTRTYRPEELQALRAIEVLERIGTPEVRPLLEKLAQGAAGAILTEDAKRAAERLGKRSSSRSR